MVEEENNNPDCRNYPSPSTTGEENLRQIIDEIESLSSLSHTIRVFSVKWQVIRKKLEELNSYLIAAESPQSRLQSSQSHSQSNSNHHGSGGCGGGGGGGDEYNNGYYSFSAAARCIAETVKHCSDLAARCISTSFSGKLLMQSELDRVISRADAELRRLAGIFSSSGVVTSDMALVVVRPGKESARESMRFYVQDLLTRVKIGDLEMKVQGLVSLNEAMFEDERYVRIVVEFEDFVLVLAKCLDSNECRIQEEAAYAVAVISEFDGHKAVLVVSGVVGSLIRVVENGSVKAKRFGIRCLEKLTENGDNAWAVSAHGGVTALLNLGSSSEVDAELVGPSCWVLRNLVGVDEIKRFMIEEGAISMCVRLVKGRDEMAQVGAAEFLQSLVLGDELVRQLVVKEGGIRALVRIIDPKSDYSFKSRETALRAIENLCFSSVEYVNMLITYGFMDQLLYFLRKGDVTIQELAFKSACRLCGTSEDARKSMGDIGFMAEFVKFLEAKSYEIREMAAEALSLMVMVPKNRKKFANDEHYISLILQLVDPKEGNSGNFKFLLSIILSLSSCNHARRKIAHSGYVKNIEKLADAGVSDAKKIVRKLSTNRFKSMLNGIWHS